MADGFHRLTALRSVSHLSTLYRVQTSPFPNQFCPTEVQCPAATVTGTNSTSGANITLDGVVICNASEDCPCGPNTDKERVPEQRDCQLPGRRDRHLRHGSAVQRGNGI